MQPPLLVCKPFHVNGRLAVTLPWFTFGLLRAKVFRNAFVTIEKTCNCLPNVGWHNFSSCREAGFNKVVCSK